MHSLWHQVFFQLLFLFSFSLSLYLCLLLDLPEAVAKELPLVFLKLFHLPRLPLANCLSRVLRRTSLQWLLYSCCVCVQVINLNSALFRLCNAHWPLQRGFRVHWASSWASSEPVMLGPSGSAGPLRLSFVFLVHSARCAMLRRTFVFLMLVINNLSFAPLLSDDDDDEMSAETLSRQRIVVVFVCLSVSLSVLLPCTLCRAYPYKGLRFSYIS